MNKGNKSLKDDNRYECEDETIRRREERSG